MRFPLVLLGLLALALPARAADTATVDDTARFLAGMQVSSGSPLASLAAQPAWREHASYFNLAFDKEEETQLAKVRKWSQANISVRKPTLYYFFSGPDFLYANAFFPNATTYVMAGLEPPGPLPDLSKVSKGTIPGVLRGLSVSLRSILGLSFFITKNMQSELKASPVSGTIPVLYVFLERTGHKIQDASLIQLNDKGEAETIDKPARNGMANGVKITFSKPGGPTQTLYYFSANVAGNGFKSSGMDAFCDKFGEGVALVKSASYLLSGASFVEPRNFLLKHSAAILQDDTGVPVNLYDRGWDVKPFGHYVGPIPLFKWAFQPRMAALFKKGAVGPLDFGIGYRYRPNESSLVYAVKRKDEASH